MIMSARECQEGRGMTRPKEHTAQRLWLLERDASAPHLNVCRFVGAVAVLGEAAVHVVLVLSPDDARASEAVLSELRVDVERDGQAFPTLDAALRWTHELKHTWIARGWTEVVEESGARRNALPQ